MKLYKSAYLFLAIGSIVIIVGFWNSYFAKLGQLSFFYHLHGVSASAWMLLMVVQPWLYNRGNLKLHKRLGKISLLLVPLIVFGGIVMMKFMIHRQEFYPPNAAYQLAFIDACTLPSFALLYILAIKYRKNLHLHSRFMVSTIFGPLIPALTRVFFTLNLASGFTESLTYSYLLIELVLIILVLKERNVPEMKITYLPFLVFIIIQHVLMYFAGEWSWWQTTMNFLTGY